jgi:hypothetical protein
MRSLRKKRLSGNSSAVLEGILESLCVHGASLRGNWADNLAQVVRWAADSARLRPDDHGLVLSTYTTFGGLHLQ